MERGKGKKFIVYWTGIRMECRSKITKIDILSISSVETEVPIEKPPHAKLRADYTIPKCFINFIMIKIKHH